MYPVLARDPDDLVARLRDAGFDTTRRSSLAVVDPPPDRPELDPRDARAALARMVFVPVQPGIGERALRRLEAALGAEPVAPVDLRSRPSPVRARP